MERKTVLIVDDDPVFLDAMTAVLRQRYAVTSARDGEQAMTILHEAVPDLIILDIMMTYHSEGYDLANALKRNPLTANVPIIILTGVDKMFEIRSRMDSDPVEYDSFMAKPPDFKELMATIDSLIARTP